MRLRQVCYGSIESLSKPITAILDVPIDTR